MNLKTASARYLLTASVVLVAVLAVSWKYWVYVANPWTRDGQVQANVIQVAPRVSGPIVNLPIRDNQFVKAGDLLFVIDPRTFTASYDQARISRLMQNPGIVRNRRKLEAAVTNAQAFLARMGPVHPGWRFWAMTSGAAVSDPTPPSLVRL